MEIEKICRTCKYYELEVIEDEQFQSEPCIACTRNPDYNDEWELENDIVKETSENIGKEQSK